MGAAKMEAAAVASRWRRRGKKPSTEQGCAGLACRRPATILDACRRGAFPTTRQHGGKLLMSKSILIHETGGPEKMQLHDVDVGKPGPGQVKVRHTAIGLNYIDVYTRSGLYPNPLPNAVGREGAGVIVEVGPRVKGFKKGDRVAYCGVLGAYCQERLMGTDQLVHVPKGVSDEQAAAIMLKGMTTEYLVDHTAKAWLKKGDTILFHAAAGGVGLLFGQWAKARGYKVIGTTSSVEKAALARKNGYKWVIDYTKQDIVAAVKKITKGKGVPVVFDGVGKDTWNASLDCLQPRGLMVSFGNASGAVPPVALGILNTKGSIYVTRPSLGAYTATRKELEASAKSVFKMIKSGKVKIAIDQRYPLAEAAQAHIDLESRKTTGQTVLVP
jgi:NADPH:quinone reductase